MHKRCLPRAPYMSPTQRSSQAERPDAEGENCAPTCMLSLQMATRKTNPVASGTAVTMASFKDPQGHNASIIFTGAAANRMAVASCPCSRAQRSAGACVCAPDAGACGVKGATRQICRAKAA